METFIDLDKLAPEPLTLKVNNVSYKVKRINDKTFLTLLEVSGMGDSETAVAVKNALNSPLLKIKYFFKRYKKPFPEKSGKKAIARIIKKTVPDLPINIIKAMDGVQIEGFLRFIIDAYMQDKLNHPLRNINLE